MRVCPKCGYIDPPIWKQSAFHQEISFTKLDNIEYEQPNFANRLKKEQVINDGFYAYRLTKVGNVERQAILENPNWAKRWHIPTDRSKGNNLTLNQHAALRAIKKKRTNLNQRHLLEEPAK